MAVELINLIPGAVFRFKVGLRRILSLDGDRVVWEWAQEDRRTLGLRSGGTTWKKGFAEDAIEQINEGVSGDGLKKATSLRLLSGEVVELLPRAATFKLRTLCPAKYVVIDLSSGDVYGIEKDGLERVAPERLEATRRVLGMSAERDQ